MTDATTEKSLSKSEFNNVQLQEIGHSSGMGLAISSFAEAEKFANLMSICQRHSDSALKPVV
jgi:hypothetical protein